MRKSIKNMFLFVVISLIVSLLCPTFVNAQTDNVNSAEISLHEEYSYYNYVIERYHVDIKVNENNTYDITENISAYFNMPKHGIYRTIPIKNKVERVDGTSSTNRAKITNIKVNDEYDTSSENDNLVIKIGSPNYTLVGKKEYKISYTYDIGKDKMADYDEFYYNIIGDEWDTVIGNITFSITMPKEFDQKLVGFSSGVRGSTNSGKVSFDIHDNVITGKYDGILIHESLTARIELPEGYYTKAGYNANWSTYLFFLLPPIGLILCILMWVKYGKDDPVIETVEFYPPEGLNSLEVAFLYKGTVDNNDVVSLLVYLANKGYIRIDEDKNSSRLSNENEFKITKLKDYDGYNDNERIFLEELFKIRKTLTIEEIYSQGVNGYADTTEEVTTVTKQDLKDNFYRTVNEIENNINSKSNRDKIFENISKIPFVISTLMIILSVLAIFMIPTSEYAMWDEIKTTLLVVLFYIPFYAVGLKSEIPRAFRFFWLGFTMVHSTIFMTFMPFGYAIIMEPIFLIGVITGLVCVVGMIICSKNMSKRTKYGTEMLGKIRGFKTFLETAEKERLESMVHQNPTYFYDILPYTYVLDVSDKWMSKFEGIVVQEPDWYSGYSVFNIVAFNSFISDTMMSVKSVSVSSSSRSSGGGFSGGGFSGGGSGGGGGGSW